MQEKENNFCGLQRVFYFVQSYGPVVPSTSGEMAKLLEARNVFHFQFQTRYLRF